MRAAEQSDIQTIYHIQMPRWLVADPRYSEMNLEAKVVYTFLLNRFQLSRWNGWVNDYGEVFVIFPRKELARELRIGEKRVTGGDGIGLAYCDGQGSEGTPTQSPAG